MIGKLICQRNKTRINKDNNIKNSNRADNDIIIQRPTQKHNSNNLFDLSVSLYFETPQKIFYYQENESFVF